MSYRITFARSARRELAELPSEVAHRIFKKIEALSGEPRPPGCKKLKGNSRLWRIRVADYRIIYDIDDDNLIVDVVIVRHRKDAYR